MKIAICVPVHGDTKARFTLSLAGLLIHAGKHGIDGERPDLAMIMTSSSSVAENRENAALQALDAAADYILWLDCDQTFPPDTLVRLFKHMGKVDVVACNYPRRSSPTGPTALIFDNGASRPVYTTAESAEGRIAEQVDAAGLGVCLMPTKLLRMVERPWFVGNREGEDTYFFRKLAAVGIRPFIDHNLSWEIGHIGERVFTNADADADRGKWSLASARPLG